MTDTPVPAPSPAGDLYVLPGRRGRGLPVVISCEHGGHGVPKEYRHLFRGAEKLLESHRGWDPGALEIAEALAFELGAPLFAARTTRLLVDLNRSPGHPARFGERVRGLPADTLLQIDRAHYRPYRELVRAAVNRLGRRDRAVLHLSVHSFTPVLCGERRTADIGILYDPSHRSERAASEAVLSELRGSAPYLRVRRNYPYRGRADSLVAALRREEAVPYVGLEIEVNQRLVRRSGVFARVRRDLVDAIASAIRGGMPPSLARSVRSRR